MARRGEMMTVFVKYDVISDEELMWFNMRPMRPNFIFIVAM